MIERLLIANRGEIACRIIRTARRLGIRTIAVYSEADRGALHVELADEAYEIGPAPARESYLDSARVIDAARRGGADAVHPGYGFLSENADFAAACARTGLVFVGPPEAAIRAMGDKAQAKALMVQAGVPVVPGYHGADQDDARFADEARDLGFPVLVKASAGGGGRGVRIVADPAELPQALASARREADSAFGNGRLILEKYLARPRHIEMQIFADCLGNFVHLFERDCSIQRRHQKIVEEAPALALSDAQRQMLGTTAVAAARAVAYVGAGTVEFVAEDGAFYFIEMNTRLQVEHPVTEMITGLDLVEWQLRIASGEALPLAQDGIVRRGHAIEARLYAEDPSRDFLPAAGSLSRFRLPVPEFSLRIETGLREGDAVGVHYDPLMAKLVAWGEDRATAIHRVAAALGETRIAGVLSNRDYLLRVLRHQAFAAGEIDTGFVVRHRTALLPPPSASPASLAAASFAVAGDEADAAARQAEQSGDRHSPWQARDGWRLWGAVPLELRWRDGDAERSVRLWRDRIEIDGKRFAVHLAAPPPGDIAFELDGRRITATVARAGLATTVILADETRRLMLRDPWFAQIDAEAGAGRLTAPMPGKVLAVHVAAGDRVKRGQLLMVLEAMKMEHAIVAPADGIIEEVHFAAGDLVEEGRPLLAFAAATTGRREGDAIS